MQECHGRDRRRLQPCVRKPIQAPPDEGRHVVVAVVDIHTDATLAPDHRRGALDPDGTGHRDRVPPAQGLVEECVRREEGPHPQGRIERSQRDEAVMGDLLATRDHVPAHPVLEDDVGRHEREAVGLTLTARGVPRVHPALRVAGPGRPSGGQPHRAWAAGHRSCDGRREHDHVARPPSHILNVSAATCSPLTIVRERHRPATSAR